MNSNYYNIDTQQLAQDLNDYGHNLEAAHIMELATDSVELEQINALAIDYAENLLHTPISYYQTTS